MRPMLFLIPLLMHFVPIEGYCQPQAPQLIKVVEGRDPGTNKTLEPLLFFSDGRVGRLPPGKRSWLRRIKLALLERKNAVIQLNPEQIVDGLRIESSPPGRESADGMQDIAYIPSVVSSTEADSIFKSFNPRSRRRAQCYNRAHIWAYESFKNRSLMSLKVFMFFTLKYIREYRYKWWFHVAPLTHVVDGHSTRETVLDPIFMEGPVGLRDWSDHFIRPKTECPVAGKYSEYENLQYQEYCVFMKVPMYFWQPRDIEALEHGGRPKKMFIQDDVDYAYWQAFY
jgi:hypothetical protein